MFSFVWGHNACISHVHRYRLRRLTRFPLYCDTMRVFFTFLCTRVSLSFKTPYAFSSIWHHNACVLLACLHRFRRHTRFPPYGLIMRVLHTFICIVIDALRVSSELRHNACVFHVSLHSRFFIVLDALRVCLRMAS